jgi:hypothetical protein
MRKLSRDVRLGLSGKRSKTDSVLESDYHYRFSDLYTFPNKIASVVNPI